MDLQALFDRMMDGTTTTSDVEDLRTYLALEQVKRASAANGDRSLTYWVRECGMVAVEHGFDLNNVDQQLMLIAGEAHEAYDVYRHRSSLGDQFQRKFNEELADIVIRAFSFAYGNGINLEAAIAEKNAINHDRPWLHEADF